MLLLPLLPLLLQSAGYGLKRRYHLNAKAPSSGAIEARGLPGQKRLTDEEALRRQHRFVRDHEEDNRAQQVGGRCCAVLRCAPVWVIGGRRRGAVLYSCSKLDRSMRADVDSLQYAHLILGHLWQALTSTLTSVYLSFLASRADYIQHTLSQHRRLSRFEQSSH